MFDDYSEIEYRISDRSVRILSYLIDGPALFKRIRDHLAGIKEVDPKQPGKINRFDSMSNASLYNTLSVLKRSGYINTERYRKGQSRVNIALYALAPLGVEELRKQGVCTDYCRLQFPSRATIAHELQVVEVVRTIRKEMDNYRLKHRIEDEYALKKRTRGPRRKAGYPDLRLTIELKRAPHRIVKDLAIEIDNSTIPAARVIDKAMQIWDAYAWPTMLLCTTTVRIDRLRDQLNEWVAQELERAAARRKTVAPDAARAMQNRVFFALTSDFIRQGVLGISWERADGLKANLVPDKP